MTEDAQLLPSWDGISACGSPEVIGGKAVGLLAIPRDWTPPFVVLPTWFTALWRQTGSAAAALATLAAPAQGALHELLRRSREASWSNGILVRSNAPAEASHQRRGAYESFLAAADWTDLSSAIDSVLSQPDVDRDGLCAIAQLSVNRVRGGHLSNERRVTSRRTVWMGEDLDAYGERFGSPYTLDSRNGTTRRSLEASSEAEVASALRTVSHRFTEPTARYLCEWVWDGERVWVVQRDELAPVVNQALSAYLGRQESRYVPRADVLDLRVIEPVQASTVSDWCKSRRPVTFDALQMPTATIFLLEGSRYRSDERASCLGVRQDLARLLATDWPVVIRCDVRLGSGAESLSLPTSDPLTDPGAALEFMRAQATAFAGNGLSDDDWAFLPAYLIPARASIMVHAKPGAQRIRVDALWGFPDGIGLLPHDTWFHDVVRGRLIERQEYKGTCLTYEPATGWQFASVPEPYDWGHVLNREEVTTASSWARRLAEHLQHEVQLMVLARIDGRRGASAMMPWHFTDHQVPTAGAPIRSVPGRRIMTISRPDDVPPSLPGDIAGVHLMPAVEVRRDPDFLIHVGRKAADAGTPIYFEGSVLGHPFFLLRSAGATVVPVGADEPDPPRYDYNKLVRDEIPAIARRGGSAVRVFHATEAEAGALLRHKLLEEAYEVLQADDDRLVDELADLFEVLSALQARARISEASVSSTRKAKAAARGTFSTLAYLEAAGVSDTAVTDDREASALFGAGSPGERSLPPSTETPVEFERVNDHAMTFRVPLVPPLTRAVPLRQYDTRVGDARITFTYIGSRLEIKVEEVEPPMPVGQLSLAVEPT